MDVLQAHFSASFAAAGAGGAEQVAFRGRKRNASPPFPALRRRVHGSRRGRSGGRTPGVSPTLSFSFTPGGRSLRRQASRGGANGSGLRRNLTPGGAATPFTSPGPALTPHTGRGSARSLSSSHSLVGLAPALWGGWGGPPAAAPTLLHVPSALDGHGSDPALLSVRPPSHVLPRVVEDAGSSGSSDAGRPPLHIPGQAARDAGEAVAGAFTAAAAASASWARDDAAALAEAASTEGLAFAAAAGLTRPRAVAAGAAWREPPPPAPIPPQDEAPAQTQEAAPPTSPPSTPPATAPPHDVLEAAVLRAVHAGVVSSGTLDWAALFRALGLGRLDDGDTLTAADVEWESAVPLGTVEVARTLPVSQLPTWLPRAGVLATGGSLAPLPAVDVVPSGGAAEDALRAAAADAGQGVALVPSSPSRLPRRRQPAGAASATLAALPSWAPPLPLAATGVSPTHTAAAQAGWEERFGGAYVDLLRAAHASALPRGDATSPGAAAVTSAVGSTVADLLSDARVAGLVQNATQGRLVRAYEHRAALQRLRERRSTTSPPRDTASALLAGTWTPRASSPPPPPPPDSAP